MVVLHFERQTNAILYSVHNIYMGKRFLELLSLSSLSSSSLLSPPLLVGWWWLLLLLWLSSSAIERKERRTSEQKQRQKKNSPKRRSGIYLFMCMGSTSSAFTVRITDNWIIKWHYLFFFLFRYFDCGSTTRRRCAYVCAFCLSMVRGKINISCMCVAVCMWICMWFFK